MRRLKSRAPAWILLSAASFCGLFVGLGFRLNLTPSLPLGLYRIVSGPIERGGLVAACLERESAGEGRRRGYLMRGSCRTGASPVLKRVGAVGGDAVEIKPGGVFVGGVRLQAEAPFEDSRGRPLAPLAAGHYRLAACELWLYADQPRSWDSRFYGPVDVAAVRARVRPIWTWGKLTEPLPAPSSQSRRPR